MLYFKSDGRYNYYNKGYQYIAEFKWNNREERDQYFQLCKVLTEMYGPDKQRVYKGDTTFFKTEFNPQWLSENKKTVKRRRIYFKEEASLSMAMLKM